MRGSCGVKRIKIEAGNRGEEEAETEEEITMFETILENEIHPNVVKYVLYDRHVENRLSLLTQMERAFEEKYHCPLFIQCNVESLTNTYYIDSMGVSVTLSW